MAIQQIGGTIDRWENGYAIVTIDTTKVPDIALIPRVESIMRYTPPQYNMNYVLQDTTSGNNWCTDAQAAWLDEYDGSKDGWVNKLHRGPHEVLGGLRDSGIDCDNWEFSGGFDGLEHRCRYCGGAGDDSHGSATASIIFGRSYGMCPDAYFWFSTSMDDENQK